MWHRDTKGAEAVGKMVLIDLLVAELPQTFNLFKKKNAIFVEGNKVKQDTTRYVCSLIDSLLYTRYNEVRQTLCPPKEDQCV